MADFFWTSSSSTVVSRCRRAWSFSPGYNRLVSRPRIGFCNGIYKIHCLDPHIIVNRFWPWNYRHSSTRESHRCLHTPWLLGTSYSKNWLSTDLPCKEDSNLLDLPQTIWKCIGRDTGTHIWSYLRRSRRRLRYLSNRWYTSSLEVSPCFSISKRLPHHK